METNKEIQDIQLELCNCNINGQRRRYLENKLDELNNISPIKKSFNQFCYENPWAPECRIYDL